MTKRLNSDRTVREEITGPGLARYSNERVLVLFANPVPYFNGTKSVRIDFSVWGTYDWDEHGPLVRLENHGNAEEIYLKRGDEIRVTQAHRGSSTGRTHRTYMFSHK